MRRVRSSPYDYSKDAVVIVIFVVILSSTVLPLAESASAQTGPGPEPAGSPDTYSLVGTIGGAFSGAVLSVGKGEQLFYRLYDTLPDGAKLVGVRTDSISVKGTDGTSRDVYISHETKPYSPAKPVAEAKPAPPVDPYTGGAAPTSFTGQQNPNPQNVKRGRTKRIRSDPAETAD